MRNLTLTIVFALVIVGSVNGQSASDIERNFNDTGHSGRYAGHGVTLLVKFDAGGQVCSATWPMDKFPDNRMVVGRSRIDSATIKLVLDLIAPRSVRGNPIEPWSSALLYGGTGTTTYTYEKVTLYGFFGFSTRGFEGKFGSDSFTLIDRPDEVLVGPDELSRSDYFEKARRPEEMQGADMVELRWNDRKCVE